MKYILRAAVYEVDEVNNLEMLVSETHADKDGDTINAPTQAAAEEIADEMMNAGQAYVMRIADVEPAADV